MPPLDAVYSAQRFEAASWVLINALGATPGTAVLVIHDEASKPVADCLFDAAKATDINVRLRLVSKSEQESHYGKKHSKLDESLRDEIDRFSRIVLVQELRPELSRFRFILLEYGSRQRGKRMASMPGVSLQYLTFCGGDLDELVDKCSLFADRLVWAREITVVTRDMIGQEHKLTIPIGEQYPRTSTGRVPLGGWCNVPSGETFIVPNVDAATGSVVIDGSLLGYPIPNGECLVLTVSSGRVSHPIEITGGAAIRAAATRILYDDNGNEAAHNCTVVSELGIGLNSRINTFTGIPIFDEKIAGTAHLGLGSSKQFRGPTFSAMHNDFVMRAPIVKIDSDDAVVNGQPCLRRDQVYPNWRNIRPELQQPMSLISRTGPDWREFRKGGRILAGRAWISDRTEGTIVTQIGDDDTSALATVILWTLENRNRKMTIDDLRDSLTDGVPPDALRPTLQLLNQFRLVEFD